MSIASGHSSLTDFGGIETKPFALLRVVTTSARFEAFAGAVPKPRNWFHLKIEPGGTGLPTWHAQLTVDGYSTLARGVTKYARRLDAPDDTSRSPRPLPQSLGAAVASQTAFSSSLVAACAAFPKRTPRKAIFAILKNVYSGHISCCQGCRIQPTSFRFVTGIGRSILHYNVGFPIAFNGHTSPPSFNIDISERPPIILSHWDWDHLHAAFPPPPSARLPIDCS